MNRVRLDVEIKLERVDFKQKCLPIFILWLS